VYALVKLINQKMREENAYSILLSGFKALETMMQILGLNVTLKRMSKADRNMYHAWKDARENRDFETADRLREKLAEKGIIA
jgi:cysteinyl-tRNA synthetase